MVDYFLYLCYNGKMNSGYDDLQLWEQEMSHYKIRKIAHRAIIATLGLALPSTLLVSHFTSAGATTNREPVQDLHVAVVPSDYNTSSALITGLTPLSVTGAKRVVAEVSCTTSGRVHYTLHSGYEAPDGTGSDIYAELTDLPNPCRDFTIGQEDLDAVREIADKVGITTYARTS